MKLLYRAIIDVYNEIEEHTAKEGRSYCAHYAKVAVSHFLPLTLNTLLQRELIYLKLVLFFWVNT